MAWRPSEGPHASTAFIAAFERPSKYFSQLAGVAEPSGGLQLVSCLTSCAGPGARARRQAAWPGGHHRSHTPPQPLSPRSVLRIIITVNLRGSVYWVGACSWCHASPAVQILCARAAASQGAWPGGHPRSHTPSQPSSPRSVLRIITTVNLRGSLNRGDACSWCHASQAVQVQEPALAAAKLHSQEAIPGATRLHCTHRRA